MNCSWVIIFVFSLARVFLVIVGLWGRYRLLVLIWVCRVRGEFVGEDRFGGGLVVGVVRRDFWGLLVFEVVRGLKIFTGWSEGKDWVLVIRFVGEFFCGGRKEELGCREEERNRKGFGSGSVWNKFFRGRGWLL